MKKVIAFVLLATLVITSATTIFAAGGSDIGKGARARVQNEDCQQHELCLYDGEGPQDGTGFQYKIGQTDGAGRKGAGTGECLYDGEGPEDGTGMQYQRGAGMRNKSRKPAECPNGCDRPLDGSGKWWDVD